MPCCLFFSAATFVFQNPAIFEASSELGDITGLYMNDDEGTIQVCWVLRVVVPDGVAVIVLCGQGVCVESWA